MAGLHELPHEDEDGTLRVVVEAPKGARVKPKWDPAKDARSLGFAGPGAARKLVRAAVGAYEHER